MAGRIFWLICILISYYSLLLQKSPAYSCTGLFYPDFLMQQAYVLNKIQSNIHIKKIRSNRNILLGEIKR